jgi:hypothetical protein
MKNIIFKEKSIMFDIQNHVNLLCPPPRKGRAAGNKFFSLLVIALLALAFAACPSNSAGGGGNNNGGGNGDGGDGFEVTGHISITGSDDAGGGGFYNVVLYAGSDILGGGTSFTKGEIDFNVNVSFNLNGTYTVKYIIYSSDHQIVANKSKNNVSFSNGRATIAYGSMSTMLL